MNGTSSSTPSTSSPNRPQKADDIVDEAIGVGWSDPLIVHAKMLRLELLKVKAELERELGTWVLDCRDCGRTIHWVPGLGVRAGHWAHREPAPQREPVCVTVNLACGRATTTASAE
jgi:hypothetical protein